MWRFESTSRRARSPAAAPRSCGTRSGPLTFRAAYDALGRTHGERADVEYVRLLHLAATTGERRVEATLRARLDAGDPCDYARVQAQVRPAVPTIPVVHVPRPNLAQYAALLSAGLLG